MGDLELVHTRRMAVSDQETGRRLRIARENAKLSQAEATGTVNIARTTLVAIEQGLRRVRTAELLALAKLYGVTANDILRGEAVHVDLVPRFRKSNRAEDAAVEFAAMLINDLVSAEVELENSLGVKRTHDYPRQRPLLPGPPKQQAEEDAQELRRWLGLGLGPVFDMMSLLEVQVGIRVYLHPIDSRISGLFAWDEALGACMLFNSKHRPDRLKFTAAHELGHFLATRTTPEVLMHNSRPRTRAERYADCFATAFLMPRSAVRNRFAEVTDGQTHFTRRHVILLAHMFGVSRAAIVQRLEELELVRAGTWDWFQENGGITDQQAEQVLDSTSLATAPPSQGQTMVPIRIALLAQEAWKRELYSEGQLSRMLRLHRRDLRELVYEVPTVECDANRLPQ